LGSGRKRVLGRDLLVVNFWSMLHLHTANPLLCMRLSIFQKEGRPFKSRVISSSNGVHVLLCYNEEHICVRGESENTEWEKKMTRFWLTQTEDVKSISSVFLFCSAENNKFLILFRALCWCEIRLSPSENLHLEYYRRVTEERITSFCTKGNNSLCTTFTRLGITSYYKRPLYTTFLKKAA
jgi:hypothetical protein